MKIDLTAEQKQYELYLRENGFTEKDIEFLCSRYEDLKTFLKWYKDKGSPDPKEFLAFLELCRNNYVLLSFAVNILKAKKILEDQHVEKIELERKLKGVFIGSWNGWLNKLSKETGVEHDPTDDELFHWLIVTQAAGISGIVWRDLFNKLLTHDYDTFLEIYSELKEAGSVPYNLPKADESLPDENTGWIDFSQLGIMSPPDFAALLLAPPELNQPFPPGHDYWKVFGVTNVTEAEALGIWRFIKLANSNESRKAQLRVGLFALRNKESYKGREKFIRDRRTMNKAIDNGSLHKGKLYQEKGEDEDETEAEEVAEDPRAADYTNMVEDQIVVAQVLDIVKSGKDPKDNAVLELYFRMFKHGMSLEQEYMREANKYQALGLANVNAVKQRFHRLLKKYPALDKLK